MSTPFATADDVADIWRPLTAAEESQAVALCIKASALLRGRPLNVDYRIALYGTDPTDPAALDPVVVSVVVAGMVKRVLVNRDGAVTRSVGADGVTASTSFVGSRFAQPDVGLGELTVSDSDIVKLTPLSTPRRIGSISVYPAMAPPCDPDVYGLDAVAGDDDVIEPGQLYGSYT